MIIAKITFPFIPSVTRTVHGRILSLCWKVRHRPGCAGYPEPARIEKIPAFLIAKIWKKSYLTVDLSIDLAAKTGRAAACSKGIRISEHRPDQPGVSCVRRTIWPHSEFHEGWKNYWSRRPRSATVIMCAEALYWRCHRRLLSDYLVAHGIESVAHSGT